MLLKRRSKGSHLQVVHNFDQVGYDSLNRKINSKWQAF